MNLFCHSSFAALFAAEEQKSFPLWEAIAALATVAAVIATFVVAWYTSRDLRRTSAGSLIVTLQNEWGSDRMWLQRKRLSEDLLKEWVKGATDKPQTLDDMRTEVLDFFENLSYLVEREVLDKMMVWNIFVWDIACYYLAVARYAAEYRGPDKVNLIKEMQVACGNHSVYCKMEWLYAELREIDMKQGGMNAVSRVVEPTRPEVERYLKQERESNQDTATEQFQQEIKGLRDRLQGLEERLSQAEPRAVLPKQPST